MGQVIRQDKRDEGRFFIPFASSDLGGLGEVIACDTEAKLVGDVGQGNGSSVGAGVREAAHLDDHVHSFTILVLQRHQLASFLHGDAIASLVSVKK